VVVDTCVVREPSPFRGEECQRRSIPGSCNPPYDCLSDVDKPVCGQTFTPFRCRGSNARLQEVDVKPSIRRRVSAGRLTWDRESVGPAHRKCGLSPVLVVPPRARSTQRAARSGDRGRVKGDFISRGAAALVAACCALRAACRLSPLREAGNLLPVLARLRQHGKEEGHEHAREGDHDQQLDQPKAAPWLVVPGDKGPPLKEVFKGFPDAIM
jgi:hypothetical protein